MHGEGLSQGVSAENRLGNGAAAEQLPRTTRTKTLILMTSTRLFNSFKCQDAGLRATSGAKQTNKMLKVNKRKPTHHQDKGAQEFRQEFLDYPVFECAVVPHAAKSGAAGRRFKLLTSGSRVMLPKFRALAPHLHLGGPTRSHSVPTIDLITQQPQPPLSFAPRPEQTDHQQHRICILIHFVFIPISLICFRGVRLNRKQRVITGILFYLHLFTIFAVCTVLTHTIRE